MKNAASNADGSRLLTAVAFERALAAELNRAMRAQTFVTLVAVEARRVWDGLSFAANDGTVAELAEILVHEVRGTDMLACASRATLWLVLPDTDADGSQAVITRVVTRIDSHRFSAPLSVAVGAACCPIHAADAGTLMREAISRQGLSARRASDPAPPGDPALPMDRT